MSNGTSINAPWQRRVVDRSLAKAAQKSVDRASELIFAAASLVEENKGDGFTVQEVADAAGQSLRTLYQHFGSKDDLLLAVIEEVEHAYARLLDEAVSHYQDPLQRLTAAVYFSSRFAERTTDGISEGISKLNTKLVRDAPEQLAIAAAPVTAFYLGLVSEAAEVGAVKAPEPEKAAALILSILDTAGRNQTLGNSYRLAPPDHRTIVEFVLRGLEAEVADDWEAPLHEHWLTMPSDGFSVAKDLPPHEPGRHL